MYKNILDEYNNGLAPYQVGGSCDEAHTAFSIDSAPEAGAACSTANKAAAPISIALVAMLAGLVGLRRRFV
jgi:MYXO-CTERM domain-containing protein